ncbi:MAG TPA: HupE/UreJ family protein [Tepidisphaeraceae bacterium]|nr:HupE/UreJ family protein [Tepidisphaeraceae bacterium]
MLTPCRIALAAAVLVVVAVAPIARAHPEGFSGLRVHVEPDRVRAELSIHTRDTGRWFPPGKYPDYVPQVTRVLAATAGELLEISFDEQPVRHTSARAFAAEPGLLEVDIEYPPPPPGTRTMQIWSKHLPQLPRGHQQLLFVFDENGQILLEETLSTDQDAAICDLPAQTATTTSATAPSTTPPPRRSRSRISFFLLGVEHIVTGYDHLLFLAALLLVCKTFREAAAVITFFTVAHSITLALAALNLVRLSGWIAEPAIAASIIYVGLENLFGQHRLAWRALVTFGFGLVHGLGFASVLREVGLGSTQVGLTMPLLKFSAGLESGQLFIAAVTLCVLLTLRKRTSFERRWVPALSVLISLAGAFWLVERLVSG